jgi:Tol biopolymer transport system component
MIASSKTLRVRMIFSNPLAIGFILMCVVAIVWMAVSTFLRDNSLRYESLEIKKLTNSGDILVAALSPDGQYVAYSTRVSKGCNLYLKHIPSASTTKLWQADEGSFGSFPGLTFSPDGNYLYFIYESNLCRLARLGGEPKIIVRGRLSYFAISPDGKRLAINRFRKLLTMNEDGSDERKSGLDTTEKYIYRVISNGRAWSPDGRLIALKCFAGDFIRTGLMIHNLIDSTEIDILNPLWSRIDNVFWAADAKSLLLTGERTKGETSQIWNVSYPQGEVRQITSDANGFSDLSASSDGKSLLAIQSTYANSLWVLPSGDEFKIQKVPTGEQTVQGWASWTADNRILFVTGNSREHSLKAVYPDGSKLMTLYSDTIGFASASQVVTTFTSGGAKSRTFLFPPQIARDTRTFYFESFGSGRSNIWRVDLQSGSRQSIYQGTSLASMAMSADEEWLYITNQSGLLKVRNDGKQVDTIFAEVGEDVSELRLSPDGSRLAGSRYNQKQEQFEAVVVDVKSGNLLQTLPITSAVKWTPDGRGLCFIDRTKDVPNIWTQSLAGGGSKQITHFPSDDISDFAWSPDGKHLAVVRRSNPSDLFLLTVNK